MVCQQEVHRINRLVLNVQALDTNLALQIRKSLRDHWEKMLPELESGFNAFDDIDGYVHIPKLKLKIKYSDTASLIDDIPLLLRRAIQERIRNGTLDPVRNNMADNADEKSVPRSGRLKSAETAAPAKLHQAMQKKNPSEIFDKRQENREDEAQEKTFRKSDVKIPLTEDIPILPGHKIDETDSNRCPETGQKKKADEAKALPVRNSGRQSSMIKAHIDDVEVLAAYIKTGRLPWYANSGWNEKQLKHCAMENRDRLVDALSADGGFFNYFRIVRLLGKKEIPQLVENVLQRHKPYINIEFKDVKTVFFRLVRDVIDHRPDYACYAIVANLLVNLRQYPVAGKLPPQVILGHEDKINLNEWRRATAFLNSGLTQRQTLLSSFLRWVTQQHVLQEEQMVGLPVSADADSSKEAIVGEMRTIRKNPYGYSTDKQEAAEVFSSEFARTRRVTFAGIVLLHPYLVRFLKACNITLIDGALPVECVGRAVCLLHYLVCGTHEGLSGNGRAVTTQDKRQGGRSFDGEGGSMPERSGPLEFQCELFKILLGVPVDFPLPVAPGLLTPSDMDEADELVDALIKAWPVLKQSSVSSVRKTFLCRPGILSKIDEGWALQVKRIGQDALLDYLPFSFTIVKLPWMKKPIHVTW